MLHVVEQDPTVLTLLLQKLLLPVPFSQVLALADPSTFLALISSPASPIQLLGLFLLRKATPSTGDVAIVATWNDVCRQLVNITLCANDTAVHREASQVLLSLLLTDLPSSTRNGREHSVGSGLFWRRVFSDKDIYQMILQVCSWRENSESFAQKTRAQSRLLALIPDLVNLNWGAIMTSSFADLVQRYTIGAIPASNLLDFATYGMIRPDNDVMMGMLHIEYFADLLFSTKPSEKALAYLSQPKVAKHQEAIGLFLHPHVFTKDEMDIRLLESRAGKYCSAYALLCPQHLLSASSKSVILPKSVKNDYPAFSDTEYTQILEHFNKEGVKLVDLFLTHIAQALDPTRTNNIAYNPPTTSLHLLSSLPTVSLISPPNFSADSGMISRHQYDNWASSNSVVTLIPLSPPMPEYISTLGNLFSRSQYLYSTYVISFYNQGYQTDTIAAVAPDLSPSVFSICMPFWTKILAIAEAPALAEACLAAISLIQAVARTTVWDGVVEIMKQSSLMKFILSASERHTARRVADPESTEFRIAMLKYEIVQILATTVKEVGGNSEGVVREIEGVNREKAELARKWGKVIMRRAKIGMWDSEQQPLIGTMEE